MNLSVSTPHGDYGIIIIILSRKLYSKCKTFPTIYKYTLLFLYVHVQGAITLDLGTNRNACVWQQDFKIKCFHLGTNRYVTTGLIEKPVFIWGQNNSNVANRISVEKIMCFHC